DLIAELAQAAHCVTANIVIVFHHQDRLACSAARYLVARARLRERRVGGSRFGQVRRLRQIELGGGAEAWLAVELHMTAALGDEAIDLAESQPGAAPALGCEERLEHLPEHVPGHSSA